MVQRPILSRMTLIPLHPRRSSIQRLIVIRKPWLFGGFTASHKVEEESAAKDGADTKGDEVAS